MTAPVTRLVHTLTDDGWNKARRNSAARLIAITREASNGTGRRHFPIVKQGVVGRYDRKRAELLVVVAEAGGCAAHINSEVYRYQGTRRTYSVVMFGHESDMDRAIALYEALIVHAVAHMMEITGTGVGKRRREYMEQFLSTISARLQEIGTAPSVKWLQDRHEAAYAAREAAGVHEFHRELA